MSSSLNTLANAAVTKTETLDHNAATIASLTTSVAELTATNKRLVVQLAEALIRTVCGPNAPPPGIPAPSLSSSTTLPQTMHTVNTAGVACPAMLQPSGRYHFVMGQHCKTCDKQEAKHVPSNYLELPANAGRKVIVVEINKRGKKKSVGK